MASHHTICVTDDEPAVTAFLQTVMGQEIAAEFVSTAASTRAVFGWPEGTADTTGRLFGSGFSGLVEVITRPKGSEDTVPVGATMVSFAVRDLEERVAQCRALGIEVTDVMRIETPSTDVSAAVVTVGGIRFELVRFENP